MLIGLTEPHEHKETQKLKLIENPKPVVDINKRIEEDLIET